MNQTEKRLYLIQTLLNEQPEYRNLSIPQSVDGQKKLLRSLLNVRPPKPIPPRFLEIQDEYLTAERDEETIVDAAALPSIPDDDRIALWQGDITTLRADAIVNAANSGMCGCFYPLHSCIDNIIHSKSGTQLRLYCAEIMHKQGYEEPTGQAKITPAFNLPCRYILHTVGPIIQGPVTDEDQRLLASCYQSCLELADENGVESIAFCCISTGEFHFPNELAAQIAIRTVKKYLHGTTGIKKVIFNVFKNVDYEIYAKLLHTN